ncbi:MAG: hypothetical protein ACRCT1_22820 [Microcoleaceae cyanobacterium]
MWEFIDAYYDFSESTPFSGCSSTEEALETYRNLVEKEREEGIEQGEEPDYFLEFVEASQVLEKTWYLAEKDEDLFLGFCQLLTRYPGILELAEIVVSGDWNLLCF